MLADENFRKYATERQWDIYETWVNCDNDYEATAKQLGINVRNTRAAIKRLKDTAALKGYSPEHDMTHKVHELFNVKGISGYYDREGNLKGQWVKSTLDNDRHAELIKASLEALARELPKVPPTPLPTKAKYQKDLLCVYPIGDAHVGMKAWAAECGEDFDLAIAEQVHCGAIDSLVQTAPQTQEAVIIDLGDFLHADNMAGVTSRSGHTLDMAGRFAEMVHTAVAIKLYMIAAALKKHRKVTVYVIPGNHNDTGAIWMAVALYQRFANEPRVEVCTSPAVFAYHQFGKTLFGMHHGHTCKLDKLPSVMATDMPEAWGKSRHRYWYTGHVHHASLKEYSGCLVETFRTLAAKDAYAAEHGYRAGRDMKCIVLHETYGEVARHAVNPDMIKDLVA